MVGKKMWNLKTGFCTNNFILFIGFNPLFRNYNFVRCIKISMSVSSADFSILFWFLINCTNIEQIVKLTANLRLHKTRNRKRRLKKR